MLVLGWVLYLNVQYCQSEKTTGILLVLDLNLIIINFLTLDTEATGLSN